jgi:cation transport regulator ChaC
MARQVLRCRGPSGSNRDYLVRLAAALRELGADDPHVFELERRVRELENIS